MKCRVIEFHQKRWQAMPSASNDQITHRWDEKKKTTPRMTHRLKSQNHWDYYRKTMIESNTFLKWNQLILISASSIFVEVSSVFFSLSASKFPSWFLCNKETWPNSVYCGVFLLSSVAVNLLIWSRFGRATKLLQRHKCRTQYELMITLPALY